MKTCVLLTLSAAAMYGQILPPGLGPAAPGPASAAAPQAEMGPNTVVATVAGIGVTLADVRKMLESAPTPLAQAFQQNPQQAIGQVFEMRYLADEAAKAHLDEKSPYKEQLEELYALVKQNFLSNAMVNEEQNGFLVGGPEIDAFYQKNQARWAEAKIKIILIAFKPTPAKPAKVDAGSTEAMAEAAKSALEATHPLNERTEAEALKLAGDLVKQLRGGADFAKLVAQYSDDAESKSSGGDFGTPIKATSSYAAELKKSVFAMQPGDISDPVRQGNGFYIVRLEEMTVLPINDVRAAIVKEIRDNHLNEFLTGLTKRFTPQIQRPEFFAQPGKYLSQPK